MPRPLVIATWPQSVREALNDRLRVTAYSSLLQTTEWLAARGYKASKSALHVYSMRLRQVDADNGVEAARLLLKSSMSRKTMRATRAGSWRSRLAAASTGIKAATATIEMIADRAKEADNAPLREVAEQLKAVITSLEALQNAPLGAPPSR